MKRLDNLGWLLGPDWYDNLCDRLNKAKNERVHGRVSSVVARVIFHRLLHTEVRYVNLREELT